jgi:type III restriction enzyme
MDQLLPPLVVNLRRAVKTFRDSHYEGATEISKSLLNWWFMEKHIILKADGNSEEFRYFFAQREALETIIYLYDVINAKSKFDLMRFDSSGKVKEDQFESHGSAWS